MKSPFFWHNVGLLLLMLANLVLCMWLVVRRPVESAAGKLDSGAVVEKSSAGKSLPVLGILLRAIGVIYGTGSCLLLCFTAMQFRENEFSPQNQECWRQRASYPKLQVGMTQKQVLDIMGEPQDIWRRNENDLYRYLLNPSATPDYASVTFNVDPKNPGGGVVVVDKYPDDSQVLALNRSWSSHLYTEYVRQTRSFRDKGMVLCWLGILLAAFLTLIPFWPCNDFLSLALYFPLIGLTLGITNEFIHTISWRWDLFVLVPAYVVIAGGWVIRVIVIASKP